MACGFDIKHAISICGEIQFTTSKKSTAINRCNNAPAKTRIQQRGVLVAWYDLLRVLGEMIQGGM